ncbi:MAG: RNA polymerase sigma factor [Candidatus Geothermincolia bacterium]
MSNSSENEKLKALLAKATGGDSRAYGKIFKLCYKDIYDYIIRRVGNHSDAEDITMQVFAQGLKAITSYEDRGHSVKAWLYRIAHNAVVDHFRGLRVSIDIDGAGEIPAEIDIERGAIDREEIRGLYREIVGLPAAQAEVLVLRFVEDRSVAETAMILDKKEVTVRALQFKGIRNLRDRLGTTVAKPEKASEAEAEAEA